MPKPTNLPDKELIRLWTSSGTLNQKLREFAYRYIDSENSEERDYFANGLEAEILKWSQQRELRATLDTISDMIIECYNHDNPLEIAKELEDERRTLQNKLEKK